MYSETIRAALLDGALADHKNHYAGYCRGFYVTMVPLAEGYRLTVNASKPDDPGNAALYAFLEQARQKDKKITTVGVSPYRFHVTIKAAAKKKIPERVNGIMTPILQYLAAQGYTTGCGCCGTTAMTLGCWQVNSEVLQMCEPCAARMEQEFKNNQKLVQEKKSNFVGGLLGAVLGALLGSIVWILLGRLGYIAGIGGLAIVFCAVKGYSMLGGHLDRKGVICAVLVSLAVVFFANKVTWSWSAYNELKDYGYTFSRIFRNLGLLLKEVDVMDSFILDLVIGYLLTALASFVFIRNALRESTGGYTFKRVQ